MKMKEILKTFGYDLWRSNGWWHACRPGEGPANSDYAAGYWRDLIESIVPRPPADLRPSPAAIASWARECVRACQREIDPEALAKAAFEAHDMPLIDEHISAFIDACRRIDKRWLI